MLSQVNDFGEGLREPAVEGGVFPSFHWNAEGSATGLGREGEGSEDWGLKTKPSGGRARRRTGRTFLADHRPVSHVCVCHSQVILLLWHTPK